MDFRTFVRTLGRHWKIVTSAMLTCLIGAGVVTAFQTKSYQASTTILVSFTGEQNLNEVYSGTQAAQQRLSSYAVIAAGHTVAQRAVDQLHVPISADALVDATKVAYTPQSMLFTLTVEDTNPERAAALAGAMADQFTAMVPTLGTTPRPPGSSVTPLPLAAAPAPDGQGIVPVANETPALDQQPPNTSVQPPLPLAMATVVERSGVPSYPIKPVPARNMAMGLIAGVLLAIGAALTRNAADRTVRDREALEQLCDLPTLAELAAHRRRSTLRFGTDGAFDDAVRSLRARLLRLMEGEGHRMLVAAPFGGEGTTTTALNLALSFTELGERVLLVEGDPRRPVIAGLLNVTSGNGLASVLAEPTMAVDMVRPTSTPGLFVLAARTARPDTLPCSAFAADVLESVFETLATRYDRVIVDGPPPLATADTRLLAGAVEATVLVVRAGRTTVDEVKDALYALRPAVASGTVLTDARVSRHTRAAIRAYRRKPYRPKVSGAA